MTATENTQSIAEFRETAAATIERVNQTGEPEFITVDGEARAVVLSRATYDAIAKEYWLARDVEVIRRSMREIDAGNGQEAGVFFAELRAKLLAMKADHEAGRAK